MPTDDTSDLHRIITALSDIDGRGTELVSLYVPPDRRVSDAMATLNDEYGQAANIKSKRTRTNVQSALKSLRSRLRQYETLPENGLAMFSGAIEDTGGKTSVETHVLDDLPQAVPSFVYRCNSAFETEPLKDMLEPTPSYGLIVLDKRDAHVGVLSGSSITHLGHVYSLVPGKHKAGGQSQQRFARLRLDAINEFYKKVARLARGAFLDARHEMRGILLGGPSPTKDEFLDGEYLHHELQSLVLGTVDVGDTTERGLTELVERGGDYIEEAESARQRAEVASFFSALRDDAPVAYGLGHVRRASSHGAVDTLLVGCDRGQDAEEVIETVTEYGGDVVEIERGFEKGEQFHRAFDGLGARLRFEVN